MAKKSKRPPARRTPQQQRPQSRPSPPPSMPLAGLSSSTTPATAAPAPDTDDEQDDYAATAIPYSETDGPMPLPPAEEEEPQPAPAPQPVAASTSTPVAAGATVSERRRVGRIDPTQAAARQTARAKSGRQQSTAAMFEPLPPDDDAIPFDRVPYVPGDLRRVLVIALCMVVLVIVADIVISNVVK